MIDVQGYAAHQPQQALAPFSFSRRDVGTNDVLIDIHYCGICHSDIHQARAEWGEAIFPMVPGHEIAGIISKVGSNVKKYKTGEWKCKPRKQRKKTSNQAPDYNVF